MSKTVNVKPGGKNNNLGLAPSGSPEVKGIDNGSNPTNQTARRVAVEEDRYEKFYRELRVLDYDIYRDCIGSANALQIQHDLSVKCAADIEKTLIMTALGILNRVEA